MQDTNEGKEETEDFSSDSHVLFVTLNLVISRSFQNEKAKKWSNFGSAGDKRVGKILQYHLLLEQASVVVNENNGNPTCSLLGSKPIKSIVVFGSNLIGHHLASPLL